jgi:hypothetical protein
LLEATRGRSGTSSHHTVIIQHDARDIDELPVFPASAK